MKLSEYILLSEEERMRHIDLSTPCELRLTPRSGLRPGGLPKAPSKDEILNFLGINNDVPNWQDGQIHRCHACDCDSLRGWCSNPRHYYIGTPQENALQKARLGRCSLPLGEGGIYYFAETDTWARMPKEEAEALGGVHVNKGRTHYINPETLELVMCHPGDEPEGFIWRSLYTTARKKKEKEAERNDPLFNRQRDLKYRIKSMWTHEEFLVRTYKEAAEIIGVGVSAVGAAFRTGRLAYGFKVTLANEAEAQ